MKSSIFPLVLMLSACGSSPDPEVVTPGKDATTSDVATNDTGVPTPDGGGDAAITDASTAACDPAKPFGAPVLLSSIDTTNPEGTVWLSEDEKIAYVGTVRADSGVNAGHIFVGVRPDLTDSFGALTPLPGLAAAGYDESPSLTPDALTLLFDSSRGAPGQPSDLFIATRINTLVNFGAPTALAALNSPNTDGEPNISPDGKTLYFESNRNSAQYDLFVATDTGSGFALVTANSPVTALNGAQSNEGAPVSTRDGLTLYFSSNRNGSYRVFVSTRATKTDPFGAPKELTQLNSTAGDTYPQFISPDGCRLYGAGILPNGAGSLDIWVTTKPK